MKYLTQFIYKLVCKVWKKTFDPNYEGGKCPYGYEYVESYITASGRTVQPYCRKLKYRKPRKIERMEQWKENRDVDIDENEGWG